MCCRSCIDHIVGIPEGSGKTLAVGMYKTSIPICIFLDSLEKRMRENKVNKNADCRALDNCHRSRFVGNHADPTHTSSQLLCCSNLAKCARFRRVTNIRSRWFPAPLHSPESTPITYVFTPPTYCGLTSRQLTPINIAQLAAIPRCRFKHAVM